MATYEDRTTDKANRRFMRDAMGHSLLEPEQETKLARRWKNDKDVAALHQLTTAYLRLVVALATRFRNYGLPVSDLVQEGSIGLMQAASRFDPERGVRFSTYATWWVRAQMQDFILRNWSIVRIGSTASQKSLFFNMRRLRALIGEGARENLTMDAREKIASRLHVSPRDVEEMEVRLSAGDRSLNGSVTEDGEAEWQDFLTDEQPLPDEQVEATRDARTRAAWIEAALATLSARELDIIKERKLREETVTLESLGEKLGISKERVRQIESQALRKLKTRLLEQCPDPADCGFTL